MRLDALLPQLNSVRPRGNGRYSAKCPAHADKNPSLGVSEGEKGVLLRCWSGCTVEEICRSLGLEQRDLFFDAPTSDPQRRREAAQERDRLRRLRERQARQQGAVVDVLREAEYFVHSRQGLDISTWSDSRLNDELNALAAAYTIIESEAAA